MINQRDDENLSEFGKKLFNINVNHFSYIDYGLFSLMLIISVLIGIYYGFISKRKQDSPAEYILGNKEMTIFPVAVSLAASHISGISMLALPADIYANGLQYILCFLCLILVGLAVVYLYLPVFFGLQVTSCFTYLEMRFDKRVRTTASLMFSLSCLLFIPIIIYIPALAFNQVSGVNLHLITVGISILCIFYTTIGGIRTVVWTDTIQMTSMVGALLAVMWMGTYAKGGIGEIIKAAGEGGRLDAFNMDPNPFQRMSFWSITIGMSTMWIYQMAASQSTVQRCLSLPNIKNAQRCIWLACFMIYFLKISSIYIGLLIFTEYKDCDPLSVGAVKKLDQVVPLYVMEIAGKIPGLSGLFIAGIFGAALSSMSTTLNSLSATIFEDLIKPSLKNVSEKKCSTIMKMIVVCLGLMELGLVFVVEKLGALMHLSYSINGVTSGTLLGIFTIGMLSRRVNTKGVVIGAISSLLFVSTILVGAQYSTKPPPLPLETSGCFLNTTGMKTAHEVWVEEMNKYEDIPAIFRTSFLYYAFIGVVIMAVVAFPISYMTETPQKLDERLLATFIRSKKYNDNAQDYATVENALKTVNSDAA